MYTFSIRKQSVFLFLVILAMIVVAAPYRMAGASVLVNEVDNDQYHQEEDIDRIHLFVPVVSGSFTGTTTRVPSADGTLTIAEPLAGAAITNPLHVAGQTTVWPFEATLQLYVKDASGSIIGTGYATVDGTMLEGGPFSGTLTFVPPATAQMGVLEVVEISPKDGSIVRSTAVPVHLRASQN